MTNPILYSYWRSSCSYRVRIALALKGMDYDYRAVHLVKEGGEQKLPDYVAMNPMAQVPTLIHGDVTLTQSMAILQYLEAVGPEPRLLPSDPAQQALVLSLCEDINSGMQPIQNLSVLQYLDATYQIGGAGKVAWCQHWIAKGFAAFEQRLAKTAGVYAVGDTPTLVDCLLIPQIYNGVRFEVDMDQFPTLARVNETCLGLPAFKQAHPDHQPDTP